MRRLALVLFAALVVALALPAASLACSRDDKSYFDAFPDASCLLAGATNTEIDTLGGLRLRTNGAAVHATWDLRADFENGISYASRTFAPVDRSSLDVVGNDPATGLELPKTTMPLAPASQPVLAPAAATWLDSDGVRDPSVVKVGSQYVMYYTGVAENGSGPAIFRLTSATGAGAWTRPADPAQLQPVLTGTAGAFDAHGVYGADVVYDATDTEAPYRMWYTGAGDTFDQVGYATSTDGLAWTKHDGDDVDVLPDPVVRVGLPGSQDSFSVAHPSVLFDGGLWKMFYEGDDSAKKSIFYATSTDGLSWSKAGAVIQSGSGNVEFGVFAPTVWKSGNTFEMLVGGRKETQQNSGTFQTKLIAADSTDGLHWTLGSIALNTANFASSNLSSPDVLAEGNPLKLYYSGNKANEGDPRDRIGFASGTGGTAQTMALDIAPRSALLDAREALGLSAADPGGSPDELAGVYVGLKEDAVPRLLGAKSDTSGKVWTKVPVGATNPLLALGTTNQFDQNGQRDPDLVYDQDSGANAAIDYLLFYTGVKAGVETIGLSTATETATTKQPDASTWTNPGATAFFGLGTAGQFDETGVSHPSVAKLGNTSWALYYTGRSGNTTAIGRATSTSAAGSYGNRQAITLNPAPAGSPAQACDEDGRRDPVAVVIDGVVNLLYVGLQTAAATTVERTCWAKATTAGETLTFDRMGPVLNPSQAPYAFDERAIAPSSIVNDGGALLRVFTDGSARDGRTHAGYASTALPLAASATLGIPSGWATYELGAADTPVRDFQQISATVAGTGAELWMAVLQPYSSVGTPYWSRFFPVDAVGHPQALNFQLGDEAGEGVRAVRWQVRLRRPQLAAQAPHVDKVVLDHAPVSFFATGDATTADITPPSEFTLQSWTSMTVTTKLFRPLGTGAASGTVTVLDDTGATVVAATPLTVPGDTTVSLAGVDAAAKQKLRAHFDLASASGEASPLVTALKVDYVAVAPDATPAPSPSPAATPTPPPPPPPPPPALTLAAAPLKVVYGRTATLSGALTQAGSGLLGQAVTVTQQPIGAAAPAPLATATTAALGAWSLVVKPSRHTTYGASAAGVAAAPAPVTVQVAHKLTLKLKLRGRKATFSGALAPKHARRTITIQRKSGTRWKKLVTVKTTRKSTFSLTKKLAKGRYRFRAITAKDVQHLAGRSAAKKLRVR